MLPASMKNAGNLCATLELNLALSGSWNLAPTNICPWVQCFIPFSRYPYLNGAIERVTHKQTKYSLLEVGTEIAFLQFLRK